VSFATSLALLVGALVALPILAHLLRRGKTQEQDFPPAHLVPTVAVTSAQRRRLEDRALLALRSIMVLALAVLGATPFVRCSRLSVNRPGGASVALAIIIDDSQSMRMTLPDGSTRFDRALRGATELLASARDGDAVALLLGGQTARLALGATADLTLARQTLASFHPSDRSTDLAEAVSLARAALKDLPHVEKRIVLLSDLAGGELPPGEPAVWTPLPELSEARPNCGIASAERQGRSINIQLGCTDAEASRGRAVELRLADEPSGKALGTLPLELIAGEQRLTLDVSSFDFALRAQLTGTDALPRDNQAFVSAAASGLKVGVIADARAAVVTGGPTVVEQALSALDENLDLKPVASLPESAEDLAPFAALVIDDPAGLSPAVRAALGAWVNQGGVLVGLLGPGVRLTELTSSVEPFARQGVQWEAASPELGIETKSLDWLGDDAQSLAALGIDGRVRLDASDLPGAKIVGRWTDGVPFLFRREQGRGLILTAGLPASVAHSDFALRPGFLALLQHALSSATERRGPSSSRAGTPWLFPADDTPQVNGPMTPNDARGSLPIRVSNVTLEKQVTPDLTGLYVVETKGRKEERVVILESHELTTVASSVVSRANTTETAVEQGRVDASPEWALMILALFALELGARLFGASLLQLFQRLPRRPTA
jgi:von Willebrand factor type A domain/Aerotolerance regulator N-terminal